MNNFEENIKIKKKEKLVNNELSINKIIENKILNEDNNCENYYKKKNVHIENDELENIENIEEIEDSSDIIELEKLENELVLKSKTNSILYPKNYGMLWTDAERMKIIKYLNKNKFEKKYGLFDELNIIDIAKKLERTEYGVKEEIKKIIYNEYINGMNYQKISQKLNIPESNIKLILKIYIEKNGKKLINILEYENRLLNLQVENIKLRKELEELIK